MKIRTLGWLVGLSAIASSFVSCKQASITCVAGHAGAGYAYAAQFFSPTDSPSGCSGKALRPVPSLLWQALAVAAQNADPPATACMADADCNSKHCDTDPKTMKKTCGPGDPPPAEALSTIIGDQVGMETYHPAKASGDETIPDFTAGSVAIQVDAIGNLANWVPAASAEDEADPKNDKPFAIGPWTSEEPDANSFCAVPTLQPATAKFNPIAPDPMKMGDTGTPGLDVTYEWKNAQFYVTAASQGTQFTADLTYTQVDRAPAAGAGGDQTCAVTYHVRGLWPGVACYVPDADGNPQVDPKTNKLMVDPSQCCPEADPEHGRPLGSGINPDFPVKCDEDLGFCVLDAAPDAKLPITGPNKNPACAASTSM